MGISKLAVAWILISISISIVLLGVRAEENVEVEEIKVGGASDSGLREELEQLRAKVSSLESSIAARAQELKGKDDGIAKLEKIIQEKSEKIGSLQSEIASLQKKGAVAVEEQVGKAYARANELEKQIEKLTKEIELQSSKRDALEARANEAEKKVQDMSQRLDSLQKTSDEQKKRIRKTERALQVAEEELMRAQLEATSKVKELTEVHGAWLPPWLATQLSNYQELASNHWNERAKPTVDSFLQKASEKSIQAQKWIEPHLETAKSRWIPVVKEKWVVLTTTAEPYMQTVSSKSVEFYEASKSAISPHVVKAQEFADPYFQEAKKLSEPYINQVAKFTKPHVEKVRVALKPYTKQVVHAYGKFLKSATTYHRQVQATILDNLKKHDLTKPLATKELVWFLASALLALPVFFIYRLLSDIFCKKAKKPTRNANANHAPRRPKRRHADK
ncbi:uncharacterized protein [Typha latifolia]|uniref:uncharacterized protein isoform X2 n=1 Tax=Typha latifolia TaxID=4733 RepID=UPI003C2ABA73